MTRKNRTISSIPSSELPDLRKQTGITLWLLFHFFILLYMAYEQWYDTTLLVEVLIFLLSLGLIGWKCHHFLRYRDRGQRTLCFALSMTISFIVTVGCAYLYEQDGPMAGDMAVLFGMGFLLLAMTLFQTFRPLFVKGNVVTTLPKAKRKPPLKRKKK